MALLAAVDREAGLEVGLAGCGREEGGCGLGEVAGEGPAVFFAH